MGLQRRRRAVRGATGVSGASIRIELDGAAALAMLTRVESGALNALPLFTEIGSALEASTRERIETTKVGPDGTPWVDLTPRWQARKAKLKFKPGILTMRGDLLNSVTFEAAAAHVDIIAGPTEYAAIHQFGGTAGMPAGAAAIPARPYLGLSAADETEIDEATEDWLGRMVAG